MAENGGSALPCTCLENGGEEAYLRRVKGIAASAAAAAYRHIA